MQMRHSFTISKANICSDRLSNSNPPSRDEEADERISMVRGGRQGVRQGKRQGKRQGARQVGS
jgi:hypothetical protein